ncbi:MAG: hypothetical protein JWM53_6129, partial [bacterium]|nr:hypothetical protein [bacterium]
MAKSGRCHIPAAIPLAGKAMLLALAAAAASTAAAAPVLPPGREALVAELLGGSDSLPGGCKLDEATIRPTRIEASYRCVHGMATLELRHPSQDAAAIARTQQFDIVAGAGADTALVEAVAARLRAHEGQAIWSAAGSPNDAGSRPPPPALANDQVATGPRGTFDAARASYERAEYRRALEQFTSLARASPTEATRGMAIASLIASRPTPAEVARSRATAEAASADALASLLAGVAEYAWGEWGPSTRADKRRAYAAALPRLEQANADWPADGAIATLRALCLSRLGRNQEASPLIAGVLALHPHDAAARWALAEIAQTADRVAGRAALELLARDDPSPAMQARARELLARLRDQRGPLDTADLFDPLPTMPRSSSTLGLQYVARMATAGAALLWLLLLWQRRRGRPSAHLVKWCLLLTAGAIFALCHSASAGIAVCALLLVARDRRLPGRRQFRFDVKLTHALPTVLQLVIFSYWAIYFAPAREQLTRVIPSQLAFAFAFDLLIGWALYRRSTLTLGPVPVVLSTNLFIWFPASHAYLAEVVIGTALAGKALLTTANGRHLFNPSGLGTSLVGLLCLVAPRQFAYVDIAQPLNLPPNMLEVMFLAALIPQLRLRTAPVTLTACVAMIVTSRLIGDPRLPVPLWPGWFLTITLFAGDPATMPRSAIGRGVFGAIVGVGVEVIAKLLLALTGFDYFAKVFP